MWVQRPFGFVHIRGPPESPCNLVWKFNEWYPRQLQISLHIRSPGSQDYSEVWNLKFFRFGGGGLWDNFHLGGYSETLGFGLSDNFHLGGVGGILKLSDLDSLTIFIGGVFWNSRMWTLWQFSFWGGILKLSDVDSLTIFIGGVFWNSRIWTLWQFSFFLRGGILKVLELDSLTIFILGGVFWNSWSWTLWQFSFGGEGGGGYSVLQNREYSEDFWTKISTTPAGSYITDSLSHTTYVETNHESRVGTRVLTDKSYYVNWRDFSNFSSYQWQIYIPYI